MPEETPTPDPVTPESVSDPEPQDPELSEGGQRALAAERAAAKSAEKRAKAAEAELDKFRLANASESEKALAVAKAEGRTEALSTVNVRIVRAELKAAAAGVLQDPDDAAVHIDLSQFEVDDDGNVDSKAVRREIESLAKAKPYLAAGVKPTPLPGGGATPSTGTDLNELFRQQAKAARSR